MREYECEVRVSIVLLVCYCFAGIFVNCVCSMCRSPYRNSDLNIALDEKGGTILEYESL